MLFGTVLLHLMPDMGEFLLEYQNAQNKHIDYPVMEVTICFGFIVVMLLERGIGSRYRQKFQDGNNVFRVGESNDPVAEKTTEFSNSKQTATDSVARQNSTSQFLESGDTGTAVGENGMLTLNPDIKDYVFAVGISVHALIEGIEVGFMEDASSTLFTPLIELILHKMMLAMSLVIQLFRGRVNWKATATIGVIYSMISPIGMAIGMAISESGSANTSSGMLTEAIFQALGSGALIYVVLMVILKKEFLTEDRHPQKCLFFLVGFLMVAAITFVPHDHGGGDNGHGHGHHNLASGGQGCNVTATVQPSVPGR